MKNFKYLKNYIFFKKIVDDKYIFKVFNSCYRNQNYIFYFFKRILDLNDFIGEFKLWFWEGIILILEKFVKK